MAWWAIALFAHGGSAAMGLLQPAIARRGPRRAAQPSVSILVPLKGVDAELESNLRGFLGQTYRAFELVLSVARPDDPAAAVARKLASENPKRCRLVIGEEPVSATNPKVNNLALPYRAARHDLLFFSDSNVAPAPDTLARFVRHLAGEVGIVSAAFHCVRPQGAAAELECAFLNGYQTRFLLASAALGGAFPIGKGMLFRRSDLERAGGFAKLGANPALDTGIGLMIRALGLRWAFVDRALEQPVGRRRLADVIERQNRWFHVRRINQPLVFIAELAGSLGPVLAVGTAGAAVLGLGGWKLALGTIAAWYAIEAGYLVAKRLPLRPLMPAAWMVRDALVPVLWLRALIFRRATWRGTTIDLGATPGLAASAPPGRAGD